MGKYACSAANIVGRDMVSSYLTVQCKFLVLQAHALIKFQILTIIICQYPE